MNGPKITQRRLLNYLLVPVVAAIVFLIVVSPPFLRWLDENIPSKNYQLIVQASILFVVVYIANLILYRWTKHQLKASFLEKNKGK